MKFPRVLRLWDWVRTLNYDRRQADRVRVLRGAAPVSDRFAVVVAYQPGGADSELFKTCQHLQSVGFAVVLVSNAPLIASDVEQLRASCYAVIERPNIGHDFGAYREGIKYLGDRLANAERLLLMNDSVTYPLATPDPLLPALEALSVDVASAVYVREPRKYRPRSRTRLPTLGSFFLYFGKGAIGTSSFQRFWSEYLLTGSKAAVIRYGEHGLTAAMRRGGLSLGAICSKSAVREVLSRLSTEEVRALFFYALTNDRIEPNKRGAASHSNGFNMDAVRLRDWVDRYIDEDSVIQTASNVCQTYLSCNLQKKSYRVRGNVESASL